MTFARTSTTMRLSVERIRWGLLAGALLLVAVLVVLLSYGRYRAVRAWRQIVARSGATITHETNGVTWTQAVRGKTIFMLHAAKVLPHGDGKYTLKDGVLVLYGPGGQATDRISGAQMEYDEKQGVAHAAGQVDMEIEPPAALSPRGSGIRDLGAGSERLRAGGPMGQSEIAAAQTIHVRTSRLTYVKKLGVAATDQEVEIEYAGLRGWAKGAEFDTGQSVVHLLADVRAEGVLHGAPATLTATKADLDREADVITLTRAELHSGGRTASAAGAVLHLRKDGSLEVVDASGEVTLTQGTRTVTAPKLQARMNAQSQMQHAELTGGVALVDTSAERPMRGAARTVSLEGDAAGRLKTVGMEGSVTLSMQELSAAGAPALGREIGAQHVVLTMQREHGRPVVSRVQAQGQAWARGDAVMQRTGGAPGGGGPRGTGHALKHTEVTGDDLTLTLTEDAAGKDEPESLSGTGHTRIEQRMPDGTVETSAGDALEATFAPSPQRTGSSRSPAGARGMEIASAAQTGHVAMESVRPGVEPSEGTAGRASLDGAADVVTLTTPAGTAAGRPRLTRGDTSVAADTVRIMQQTGDAAASGSVAVSFVSAKAKPGAPVTHALAAEALLHRAAQTMELQGTDAAPARMWQGASQVEAANLLLDRGRDSMQAWPGAPGGVVRAVFANAAASTPGGGAASAAVKRPSGQLQLKGDRIVRVTSARMFYSGSLHEAVFTGGVVAQAEEAQARSQRGVAFLTPEPSAAAASGAKTPAAGSRPDPVAASVDRVVMTGGVKVQQPGRTATGEQLLYTAATGEFVLTGTPGHPPHVADETQGSITGATLLFRSPDSTIVVGGVTAGLPGAHRVHTETTMKR